MTILGSRFWPSLLILVSILVFLSSWYPCAILLTSSPISSVMVLGILPTASHRSKPYFRSVSINTSHPMPELWGDILQRLHSCGQGGVPVYLCDVGFRAKSATSNKKSAERIQVLLPKGVSRRLTK